MKHVYPVRHPASLDAAAKRATTAADEPSLSPKQDRSGGRQDVITSSAEADKAPAVDKVHDPRIAPVRPRR